MSKDDRDASSVRPKSLLDAQDGLAGTEDELQNNEASTAPSFGQSDDQQEGERQSLLHQGTTEYRDIQDVETFEDALTFGSIEQTSPPTGFDGEESSLSERTFTQDPVPVAPSGGPGGDDVQNTTNASAPQALPSDNAQAGETRAQNSAPRDATSAQNASADTVVADAPIADFELETEPGTPEDTDDESDDPVVPGDGGDDPVAPGDTSGEADDPVGPGDTDDETDDPGTPGDTGGETDDPVAPDDTDDETDDPGTPGDTGGGTDDPVAPDDTDDETDDPGTPGDTGGGTDDPVGPGDTDDETDDPVAPDDTDDESDDPVVPGDGSDDPVAPGDTSGETDDPVGPGDTSDETDDTGTPGDTGGGTDDPVAPDDTDDETDDPGTPGDTSGEADDPVGPGDTDDETDDTGTPGDTGGETDDPVGPDDTSDEEDDPGTPGDTDTNEAPEALTLSNSSVAENDPGAMIGTVAASDPDGDVLSFAVDDARFEVVDGSLQLRDGVALDHEAEPTVTVTLTATDPDGATTQEVFTLTVTDVKVVPAELTVTTGFHVEQFAVVDGVLDILGVDFSDEPIGEIYTPTIDFPSTPFSFCDPGSTDVFATRVTGWINVEEEGSYDFRLTTGDSAIVWIDGVSTIVSAVEGVVTLEIGSATLGVGEHEIVIHHLDLNGDAEMTLEWMGPSDSDFSLVPASPLGTIENNDDAGFLVDIDPGTASIDSVTLTGVPDNWVISADGNASIATDGEIDVTGWDLSELVISPASDDLGSVTIGVATELRSPDGEVETSTSTFDVTIVPENGIVIDLDIDLGILDVDVDVSLGAPMPEVDLDVNLGGDDGGDGLIGSLITQDNDGGSSVLF